jgi:hypothetical protein
MSVQHGTRKLRVGYFVDAGPQPWLVRELIRRGRSSSRYEPALLIVLRSSTNRPSFRSPLRSLAFATSRLLSRLEYTLVVRMAGVTGFFRSVPIAELGVPVCAAGPDVTRKHDLDVLVHLATAAPPEDEVVSSCRLGLLLPVFGDPLRGGPPGFHEVRCREPRTAYAVHHRSGGPATERVAFSAALNTAPLWTRTAVDVTRKLSAFIHLLLERMECTQSASPDAGTSVVPTGTTWTPPWEPPPLHAQAACVARTLTHGLERTFRRALGARWRWGVAYQFNDSWQDADLSRSHVIPNPPNRYFADPCVMGREGRHICFVEDFDYQTSRARISAIELWRDSHRVLGPALEEPFHLSFPFVFEAEGNLYMCPETAEAREIRLYRCTGFPLAWTLHAVLMRDVAAVDTTLVFQGGRWWMLTNVDSAAIGEFRSELHVFHADRFDSDSWQPHPLNPVISDSARARNGGIIRHDDKIFRVFQVHGFDVYGESMGVAEVALSEHEYREEVVARVMPDYLKGIVATHTLSFSDGVLAIDFVRRERPDH